MARVKSEQDRIKLVDFLAETKGISKGAAKKLVDSKSVYVNGKRVWMAKHELNAGDEVISREAKSTIIATAAAPLAVEILFHEHGLLVANKPAGITTNHKQASLEALIQKQENNNRLKAAHRLDKDTSGCVIFSERPDVIDHLIKQFKERTVKKQYLAIVKGNVDFKERTIRSPIEHREAITHFTCLRRGKAYSLVQAEIETGRKHQIRIHLHRQKHPVAGDKDYHTPGRLDRTEMAVTRMMLHASSICFRIPKTGKTVTVTAPLPEDMKAQLNRLGIKPPAT
ncbi:MAG: 23S rRNA pseudouridine1911/1915/1917 synthase [Candidatus Omnitrophota bacterium]|jgi:23S rRNA pseudouridine1911/1915/1917 synthase